MGWLFHYDPQTNKPLPAEATAQDFYSYLENGFIRAGSKAVGLCWVLPSGAVWPLVSEEAISGISSKTCKPKGLIIDDTTWVEPPSREIDLDD